MAFTCLTRLKQICPGELHQTCNVGCYDWTKIFNFMPCTYAASMSKTPYSAHSPVIYILKKSRKYYSIWINNIKIFSFLIITLVNVHRIHADLLSLWKWKFLCLTFNKKITFSPVYYTYIKNFHRWLFKKLLIFLLYLEALIMWVTFHAQSHIRFQLLFKAMILKNLITLLVSLLFIFEDNVI